MVLGIDVMNIRIIKACLSILGLTISFWSFASEQASSESEELVAQTQTVKAEDASEHFLMLQAHEPNTVGYRNDSNDVEFMEFKISLRYPLFHRGIYEGKNSLSFGLPYFYFAFTGEWGQYLGTRDSSPVISKRFNPLLFGRYWLNNSHDYIDLTFYGHESNGQSVNTFNLYRVQQLEIVAAGDDPEFARDYISRGWDYVGFEWKKGHLFNDPKWSSYLKFKYFLDSGLMQKDIEDYNPWEQYGRACESENSNEWLNPNCKKANKDNERQNFDGITWLLRNDIHYENSWIQGNKLAMLYTTGYGAPFKNNTIRLEFTTVIVNLPIMLWGQSGYNSDLADYYEKVDSFGVAFELNNFL